MTQLVQFLSRNGLSFTDSTAAPDGFANGIPYDTDGSLAVDSVSAIDHYHMGVPLTANSRVAVAMTSDVSYYGSGSAPFTQSGRIALTTGYGGNSVGGVVFSEDGRLTSGAFTLNPIRNLIQLDPVANSHYELAKPVTFAGDFEIEVDIYIADVSAITTAAFILGNSAGANNGLWVSNVGRLLLRDDNGNTLTTDTAPITSGKLHHIKCSKVGGNVTIFVDDVEAEPPAAFGTIILDRIGIRETVSFPFDGIISNVVLRDLDTPSTQTFKLNQLNSDIEYSVENVIGSELWIDPPPDIQAGWTNNGDGSYTHTGGYSELQVDTGNPLTAGSAYVCTITVSGTGGANVQLGGALVDGNNNSGNLSNGTYTVGLSTNSNITFNAIRITTAGECTVSNISVKQITNAVNYINISQGLPDRDTYTLVDGSWTGSDLATQNVWENPASADPTIFTYEPLTNTWLMTGDGSFQSLVLISSPDQPDSLIVEGYVDILAGAGVLAFSSNSPVIGESGNYSQTGTKAVNGSQGFKRSSGVVDARFSKPSIKRLIEVA